MNLHHHPQLHPFLLGLSLVMALSTWLPAAPAHAASNTAEQPRQDVSLDSGWKFIREDAPGAEQPAFDDGKWQAVDLPHTWNNLDGEDGGNNYYRGVGWYRRHLAVDPGDAGKSFFLKFDGAATVATVYVNGQQAGEHRGNFAAFCFDVTPLLHPGQDNVLAVKVNNAHNNDVPPLSGDFTIFGGLYRDAHLLILNPLSITPLDYASPGVFIKIDPAGVTADHALLRITTELRNGGTAPRKVNVFCTVSDAAGKFVAEAINQGSAPAASSFSEVSTPVVLPHPHLWSGRTDPYLYTLTVELRDVQTNNRILDTVSQPFGVRTYRVDPNQGFFLNGKHYALHGVNRHQDRIDKGWAIGPKEQAEDFGYIMDMGCTVIRLCHYQHSQDFYNLCDRGGLIAWAELSLVNSLNGSPAFAENARQQLTELVKQNYNHPSICFWSLFNELGFKKGPDGKEDPQQWQLIADLNKLAHDLDSTRLTTAASNRQPSHPVNFITDIIAFNRYPGWYGGKPSDWPGLLDALHRDHPDRCIGISEYGAGASVFQHEDPPRQPNPGGKWHPEEWQTTVHEAAWKAMQDRPWLWGTFLWVMFDFAADQRNEGDHPGRNDKGMMTYDRKTKKDTFFWYKANWTTDPFVYITSRRFTPRPTSPVDVKIYSNCGTVELTVNGKSLGSKSSDDHIFRWEGVDLKDGDNTIDARAQQNGQPFTDSCAWTYTPAPVSPAPAAGGH